MEHSISPLLRVLDEDEDSSCDAFLYIGETLVLKAHKYILSLAVPFFKRSFRSGMKEAETGEVKFPEKKMSQDTLKTLVRAVYGEKFVINETNVRDIHSAANFLEMDEISVKCVDFMLENLNVDTVLQLWEYSLTDFAGSKKLLKGCEEFIAGHFLDLYEKENFLNLGVDFMCAFLSMNSLCVSSEHDVFDALLCWLNHDWTNRFHLINERSLLDLVRWVSIDLSVQKLPSLQHVRDHGHNSVAEKNALFMIYEKVTGLPERAKEPLSRTKRASTPSVLSEVGSLYCLKIEDRIEDRSIRVHICDLATQLFRDPQPLDMPEGANHVLGMISHGSRPFVVVSVGPVYKSDGQCLLLLELQQGRIKSQVDLLLPAEAQRNDWRYLMAAAPPNADKLCIGLQSGGSCMVAVYDLEFHHLEAPTSAGSRGSLICSQFVASIPSSGTEYQRKIRIAYTPGQIWALEHYATSSSYALRAFSYDLSSKCWGRSFVLASGANAGDHVGIKSIMVISDYIAVAVGSPLQETHWVHMFKYNDPINDRSLLQCSVDGHMNMLHNPLLVSMGQRLLVFLNKTSKSNYYAFSTMVDDDGKPTGQLSREESMDYLQPEFTLQIQ